jgi:hypothetical protein
MNNIDPAGIDLPPTRPLDITALLEEAAAGESQAADASHSHDV